MGKQAGDYNIVVEVIKNPLRFFHVCTFGYQIVKVGPGKIEAGRTKKLIDSMDGFTEETLFTLKYPQSSTEYDILGVSELKEVLREYQFKYLDKVGCAHLLEYYEGLQ